VVFPIVAGLGIIARYAASKGVQAAIKKYGIRQVKKALKEPKGLNQATRTTLKKDAKMPGKDIAKLDKAVKARSKKSRTPARVKQGERLRDNQRNVDEAVGSLKTVGVAAAVGVPGGIALYKRGQAKGKKEREKLKKENERLRKAEIARRKKEKGFPFTGKSPKRKRS